LSQLPDKNSIPCNPTPSKEVCNIDNKKWDNDRKDTVNLMGFFVFNLTTDFENKSRATCIYMYRPVYTYIGQVLTPFYMHMYEGTIYLVKQKATCIYKCT
jgi:hypothetical protein